jgi:hypothetical protein
VLQTGAELAYVARQAVSVACRAAGAGASCDDVSEDLCVAFADHVARVDVLDLASLVRRHALHRKVRVHGVQRRHALRSHYRLQSA